MNNKYLERKNRSIKTVEQIDISINILFILKEIRETSQYPYAIRKIILGKYNIDIPIQSIYTTIKKYKDIGYVELDYEDKDNKKYYLLTEKGKKFFEEKSNNNRELINKLCGV